MKFTFTQVTIVMVMAVLGHAAGAQASARAQNQMDQDMLGYSLGYDDAFKQVAETACQTSLLTAAAKDRLDRHEAVRDADEIMFKNLQEEAEFEAYEDGAVAGKSDAENTGKDGTLFCQKKAQ
jgi:hypothetical protein